MCYMLGRHVDEELLELHAMNRLQPKEADEVEEHLLVCEDCRLRLRETEKYIAGFRIAARKLAMEEGARLELPLWKQVQDAFTPRRALLAAGLGVSLVVLVAVGVQSRQPVAYLDVTLQATRGVESTLAAATGRVHYRLHLDATGLDLGSDCVVTVVDASGWEVRREAGHWGNTPQEVVAVVGKQLRQGEYFIRLASTRDPARTLREFRLEVE